MNVDITPTDGFPHMYDYVNNVAGVGTNPVVLVILTFVIVFYYLLFSYLGISPSGPAAAAPIEGNSGLKLVEILMWGLFIFLVLINGIQYFFNVDIKTGIKNIFSPVPEVDISVATPSLEEEGDGEGAGIAEITGKPQVFHVSDNKYKYGNAKALCKAYGARLANVKEVQKAYDDGAEWCGYGWSEDQMVLYPTQPKTWQHLQGIKGHEHDCGRPGVNGGYIGNPNATFGVNCYGYKPKITDTEKKIMDNASHLPTTPAEKKFNKKVAQYRDKLPNILVAPFNYDKWSQI